MSRLETAVAAELRAAFPARRPGRFASLVNSTAGEEPLRVAAAFAEAGDWTALRPEWLDMVPDGLGSALSFLSDEAIRFYIPAYLVADLGGGLSRVDPAFALVHGLDEASRGTQMSPRGEVTWTDFAHARWDGLTREQAAAVARYLGWRAAGDGPDLERGVVEALAVYWSPRAAGIAPGRLPATGR